MYVQHAPESAWRLARQVDDDDEHCPKLSPKKESRKSALTVLRNAVQSLGSGCLLRLGALSVVVLLEHLAGDTSQHVLRERAQQRPRQVQRREHVPDLVRALRHELLLELVVELQVQQIVGRQRLLTHHSLHGNHILSNGVAGVQLIGHVTVVPARHALADGGLHQTRQRRQHVDGRVDLTVVQLAIQVDLTLRNVAREIGDGMRDVIVGHGENGQLRDGARAALHAAGTFVDGGQIGVHVTRVSTATRHLLTRGRHLSKRVSVRAHVGEDDEHVHAALVREVLGGGEGEARRDDTFDGGVVGQVEEERDLAHGAVLLKVLPEEARGLHVDSHGGEHDGKVGVLAVAVLGVLDEPGLATDLGGDLVVRQAGGAEERDLLAARNGVHDIDGGDSGLNHLLGVGSGLRVDGGAGNVQVGLRDDGRAVVDGLARSVEDAAEHVPGHGRLHDFAGELDVGVAVVDAGGALEDLDDGPFAVDLQHLAAALGAVAQGEGDDLGVARELDVVQHDERAVDGGHGAVVQARLEHKVLLGGGLVDVEGLHLGGDRLGSHGDGGGGGRGVRTEDGRKTVGGGRRQEKGGRAGETQRTGAQQRHGSGRAQH
ncbi:hypothetical protein FGB62_31g125 [Gracilaria domingensis]|nr:hypothetical protein FGB62_31g125 [Gracilaria domingensis]